jgi:MFS family permease
VLLARHTMSSDEVDGLSGEHRLSVSAQARDGEREQAPAYDGATPALSHGLGDERRSWTRMQASGLTLDGHLDASGLGWFQARLFALCSLTMVTHGAQMSVVTMLEEPVSNEFGLDKLGFSLVGSAIFGGMLVGSLFGGMLADLYGRRVAMLAASTALCVFSLSSAAAPELFSFAAARILTGLGGGALVPVAGSLLLEWSPTRWRSTMVMTTTGTAFAIGTLFECGAGLLLHEYMGEGREWWRALFVVCTLPAVVSLPVMLCTLPESMHFLMVHGRQDEAHALLMHLQRVNGTTEIATPGYTQGLAMEGSFDRKQWAEMFCAEVRGIKPCTLISNPKPQTGTTVYLLVDFQV